MILTGDIREENRADQTLTQILFFKNKKISFGSEERKKKKILGEFNFGAYCYISSSNFCISNLL